MQQHADNGPAQTERLMLKSTAKEEVLGTASSKDEKKKVIVSASVHAVGYMLPFYFSVELLKDIEPTLSKDEKREKSLCQQARIQSDGETCYGLTIL